MHQYFVEFIATILFTYVVFATASPLAIGATYALILLLTYAQGMGTGFLNPAITIALASANRLSAMDVYYFCIVQVFGALVAYELYKRYKL
jgi:glycerol uptake facilitator-like aquaporin